MPLFPIRMIVADQAVLAGSLAGADRLYRPGAHIWRSLVIVLTGLIGICASFALFVAINGWQDHVEDIRFSSLARDHLQSINAGLKDATDLLYSMRAYFESLDHRPSLTEYRAFSGSLREHTAGMRDTGWAPRVTAAEREAFEQRMRTISFPDFQIQERGPDGKLARSAERAEYFPIIHTDPITTARAVAGYDLASENLRRQAVSRARASCEPAATPPITLVSTGELNRGFLGFIAVKPLGAAANAATSGAKSPQVDGIILVAFEIKA